MSALSFLKILSFVQIAFFAVAHALVNTSCWRKISSNMPLVMLGCSERLYDINLCFMVIYFHSYFKIVYSACGVIHHIIIN